MKCCNTSISYTKLDPKELFVVGDIVMIDPDTGYITRAVANNIHEKLFNSKLVVGVCIKDNLPRF